MKYKCMDLLNGINSGEFDTTVKSVEVREQEESEIKRVGYAIVGRAIFYGDDFPNDIAFRHLKKSIVADARRMASKTEAMMWALCDFEMPEEHEELEKCK